MTNQRINQTAALFDVQSVRVRDGKRANSYLVTRNGATVYRASDYAKALAEAARLMGLDDNSMPSFVLRNALTQQGA